MSDSSGVYTIRSRCGQYTRKLWWIPAESETPHPLYLFLDGEVYFEEMEIGPIVIERMRNGGIPPGSCLFISYGSTDERLGDFTCNEGFARFVAEDVVRWARDHDPALQADGHAICGVSLSGLAAAHITLRSPDVFSHTLCQSGSFWWLSDHPMELPRTAARFWLSVGAKETATHIAHPGVFQEISQIEGVEWAAEQIAKLGGTVQLHRFPGSHTAGAWKDDVIPGLEWLLRS